MRRFLPLLFSAAGLGFLVIYLIARKMRSGAVISYEPRAPQLPGGGYMPALIIPKQLTPEIINSARKWARVRGIPLQEVLATILVESSGKPRAWARTEKEDSRGLMQVNVRAWAPFLKQQGMTPDDLWDIDKNIQIGTYIYAKYRAEVQKLLAQSSCPQSAPLDVLTRLYYKGPAYVRKKILACQDASKPYVGADKAIANWETAMSKVSAVA